MFDNPPEQKWEKVPDPTQTWGPQSGEQLQDNGKGSPKKKSPAAWGLLQAVSSQHFEFAFEWISLVLHFGHSGDSLENVNCCRAWGGHVAMLYALLASQALSIVGRDVSYCANRECSQGLMIT